MIGQPAPVMDSYGAQPMQGSIAAWLARHPMFQRHGIMGPQQMQPGFAQGQGMHLGQLLMQQRGGMNPMQMFQQSRY